ncbi:MAG: TatD family hydrolase [Chitinivibrionales bacterium]
MWIDSHAHLYDCSDAHLEAVLRRCTDADVCYIINAATTLENADVVLRQSVMHEKILVCTGISPFDVIDLPETFADTLETLARKPKVVAIGECGLDDSNPAYPSIDQQLPVFLKQLALAKKLNLPAIIHSRGAEMRVLDACRTMDIKSAVFHCYTGDIATLKRIVDAGYIVSFSGIATFKKQPLTEQIRYCPLNQMVIETDSPYLAPVPHRGKKNEPCFVPIVGQKIAEIKGISPTEVASVIYETCKSLFPVIAERKEK